MLRQSNSKALDIENGDSLGCSTADELPNWQTPINVELLVCLSVMRGKLRSNSINQNQAVRRLQFRIDERLLL